MRIAVLITCHNRKQKTLHCLDALFRNAIPEGFAVEVFLVDDGSTDGTSDSVLSEYPIVHIIQGTGELYWNRGMHKAWKTATETDNYDFYLWLNDDTYLFKYALNEMLVCSEAMQHNALICGFLCSVTDNNKVTYGGATVSGKLIPNNEMQNATLINGNVVLVPAYIYKLVGFIDPIFPHAIGDYDYGLSVIEKGGEVKTTTQLVGTCEKNDKLPIWCYRTTPILKRLEALYSPLGNAHPIYFFIYEKRHFGIATALKHFISIHLRVLIPGLWK